MLTSILKYIAMTSDALDNNNLLDRQQSIIEQRLTALMHHPKAYDVGDALSQIGEAAIVPLIAKLQDSNAATRRWAVYALGHIAGRRNDPRALQPLLDLLHDKEHFVRREVAKALGKLFDGRAVDPLIDALGDDNMNVRSAAIAALGEIGDKRAISALVQALGDNSETVRHSASGVLIYFGQAIIPALIAALLCDN
jgi:HEAT repeat protein